MNNVFLFTYIVLFLLSLGVDQKKTKQGSKRRKMYYALAAGSLILLFCLLFDWSIYLPTDFFIDRIAPWVISILANY